MSFRRRMMMLLKESAFPSGYEQLEYIPMSEKYLQTDFIPTSGCKVEVAFKPTTNATGAIFGCRNGYKVNGFYFRNYASGDRITSIELGWNNTINTIYVNINAQKKHIYGVDKGVFYIDNTILTTQTSVFSPQYPIYLMAVNNAGSRLTAMSIPTGELYGSQCWDDNGNLVRDYVPAKRLSDDAQGLYDLVNDTFIILQ